jgi:hypothetical protein
MMSLKAFAPVLASLLQTTPAAIYERQRALIRAGVLPAPIGRGRGNGLPATAETIAPMLIAMMATDNLSDTDGRVKKLSDLRISSHPETGPRLIKASTFRAALVATMKSAIEVAAVEVSRSRPSANIYLGNRINLDRVVRFGDQRPLPPSISNLQIRAWLNGSVLEAIGEALRTTDTNRLVTS